MVTPYNFLQRLKSYNNTTVMFRIITLGIKGLEALLYCLLLW